MSLDERLLWLHQSVHYCYWLCVFSSGITWVLVYRTEKYKKLKAEVEKQSKKRKYLTQQGFMLGQLWLKWFNLCWLLFVQY